MHLAVPISKQLRRIIQGIEWLILIDCVVGTLSSVEFAELPGGPFWLGGFALAVGGLSLALPTEAPLNQRRLYIAAELLLLMAAEVARLNYSALFDLLVIKACLLLPWRDVLIATIGGKGLLFSHFAWRLPTLIEEVRKRNLELYLNQHSILINALTGAVTGLVFVLVMGFVFAAEQRSRRRAEALTQEVEALATKLERTRIARDIHDSLGHSLTTLDVQLALAERYQQTGDEGKLQQAIASAKQLAAQSLAEARQSLRTMRASDFELAASLQTLGEQMQPSFPVNLQVQLPALPQQLKYQLYLIAKEGLVNVQKHASATKVQLSIVAKEENIFLQLTDNGCGFDPKQAPSGYGLRGIRERAELLGGQLHLTSQPGAGSQLEVVVPLQTSPLGATKA